MAFRNMTGTTCGNGQVLTLIADDSGVSVNDFFQLDTGLCIQITGLNTGVTETNNTNYFVKEYASCNACLAAITANTRSDIPIYLNSDINNGDISPISYTPPSPVWTNNQNHAVVQANMVTLGGNGLNS